MNHFFLSYARGDDDEYIQRFHQDLCREIRVQEGLPRGEPVGFMDSASLPIGSQWSSELTTALMNSAVFLPLYAPGYFLSERCGQEWAAFERRLARHHDAPGATGGFVPVVWLRPSFIPEAARSLQYHSGAFGHAYAEYGLRQLIRLRRHKDDYEETVTALALEVVRIARRYVAPTETLDLFLLSFTDVESAFQPQGPRPPLRRPPMHVPQDAHPSPSEPEAPSSGGPRHVHFVIASTGRDEIRAVRSFLDCYGSSAQHWAPYRPELPEPLGPYACEIAAGHQLRAEIAVLDDLPERIDRAKERNQIVVLLVDPWIASIAGYGDTLLAYDRRNEPTVPVLVALSDQDQETREHRDVLARAVIHSFPNNSMRNDPIFRPDVRNPGQFATELGQTLQIAINRLMKRGTVFRVPPGPPAPPRAILEGPDSLSNRRMS